MGRLLEDTKVRFGERDRCETGERREDAQNARHILDNVGVPSTGTDGGWKRCALYGAASIFMAQHSVGLSTASY